MKFRKSLVAILGSALVLTACSNADSAQDGATEPPQAQTPTASSQATNASNAAEDNPEDQAQTEESPSADASSSGEGFNAGGYLGGTANPALPGGAEGEVSVIQTADLDKSSSSANLRFAFRNNTPDALSKVSWTVLARSQGQIVGTATTDENTPAHIQPGEPAFASARFDNGSAIPDDAEYEFTAQVTALDDSTSGRVPLTITEANVVGNSVVGSATNESDKTTDGPYIVNIFCFDGDTLIDRTGSFADQSDEISPGGIVTFSARLDSEECPSFAIGIRGWDF